MVALGGAWALLPASWIPTPAWHSDVVALQQQLLRAELNWTQSFFERDQTALTSNLSFQTSLKVSKQDVPAWLVVQEQTIRSRIDDDQETLRRLRAQINLN